MICKVVCLEFPRFRQFIQFQLFARRSTASLTSADRLTDNLCPTTEQQHTTQIMTMIEQTTAAVSVNVTFADLNDDDCTEGVLASLTIGMSRTLNSLNVTNDDVKVR